MRIFLKSAHFKAEFNKNKGEIGVKKRGGKRFLYYTDEFVNFDVGYNP